jgi:hypothetical protein
MRLAGASVGVPMRHAHLHAGSVLPGGPSTFSGRYHADAGLASAQASEIPSDLGRFMLGAAQSPGQPPCIAPGIETPKPESAPDVPSAEHSPRLVPPNGCVQLACRVRSQVGMTWAA